jgi:Uma2 family endonuclease
MQTAHGILDDVTTPSAHELPPPSRLPGQHELPSEDGEPMETTRHRAQMNHLIDALQHATRDRSDVYVAGNMFVYFSPRQLKNEFFRGPDVFVVIGAEKKERLSWVLWEEMRLPDIVIELTSESTRAEDHGPKKDVYERVWKTAVYVIFDPFTHQLDAWQLQAGRYVPAPRAENGDIDVTLLGLRLGLRDLPLDGVLDPPSLRWIDANGEALPTYTETHARIAALESEIAKRG